MDEPISTEEGGFLSDILQGIMTSSHRLEGSNTSLGALSEVSTQEQFLDMS